jgi:hypothetical protein
LFPVAVSAKATCAASYPDRPRQLGIPKSRLKQFIIGRTTTHGMNMHARTHVPDDGHECTGAGRSKDLSRGSAAVLRGTQPKHDIAGRRRQRRGRPGKIERRRGRARARRARLVPLPSSCHLHACTCRILSLGPTPNGVLFLLTGGTVGTA